jgi:hypothetical protein
MLVRIGGKSYETYPKAMPKKGVKDCTFVKLNRM